MSIFFRIVLVCTLLLPKTTSAQKLKKFNKKVGTIDSVAIMPVICNLAGAIKKHEFITNDSAVCEGTNTAFLLAAKDVLDGRCVLKSLGEYKAYEPAQISALLQDFQTLQDMKHLPDTFELSEEKLSVLGKTDYPYILLNFAEGYYLTKERRDDRNSWLVPATVALVLISGGAAAIVPKNGVVYFHSLLYDVRAKRVLYFLHAEKYTDSMYNQRLQATFLRTIYRKLYYKTKPIKP